MSATAPAPPTRRLARAPALAPPPAPRVGAPAWLWPALWLGLAALAWVYSHFVGLNASVYSDEAYTIHYYVNPGPSGFLFSAYQPNDHVLWEGLAWLATAALGHAVAIYRLTSVLPAGVAAALLSAWAWVRLGRWHAVVVAMALTLSPVLLLETIQARGYGVSLLAMAGMTVAALELVRAGPDRRLLAGFAAFVFLGVATDPIVGLGAALLVAALAWDRTLRRPVLVAGAAGLAAVALFFAPLLPQMVTTFDHDYLNPPQRHAAVHPSRGGLPLDSPVAGPALLLAPAGRMLAQGNIAPGCTTQCVAGGDLWLYGLAPLLLAVAGAVRLWRRRQRGRLLVLGLPILGSFTLLTVSRVFIADRFVLFLFAPLVLLLSIGALGVLDVASRVRWLRPALVVAAAALALFGCARVIRMTTQWQADPSENYELASRIALGSGVRPIVSNTKRPAGFWVYLGTNGFTQLRTPAALSAALCGPGPLVFIDEPFRAAPVDASCLRRAGAASIVVPQSTRGHMVVWIKPASR
jgi:hypothetical protein